MSECDTIKVTQDGITVQITDASQRFPIPVNAAGETARAVRLMLTNQQGSINIRVGDSTVEATSNSSMIRGWNSLNVETYGCTHIAVINLDPNYTTVGMNIVPLEV